MPFLGSTNCIVGTATGQSTACTDWLKAVQFLGGGTDAAAITKAVAAQGGTISRPDVKNGYTDWLPSFNATAHLTDTVLARVAYYETMVRPDFSKMYSSASLSYNFYDASGPQYGVFKSDPSGYGGNPYLKAMHATNYDASVEWYFSQSGSLTYSMFHKDLSNYIYTSTTLMPFTDPTSGQTQNFNYTTYVNGDKGKVEGFELAYTQFYDQLPGFWSGFGVQANYTKIYNSGGHNAGGDLTSSVALKAAADKSLPLEGMSNDSYNLALLYAKYDIDFRLAWNWRSKYLSSSSDANNKIPVWAENYGELDASVFYTILDHYKVGVQLNNLLRDPIYTDMGYKDFHPRTNIIQTDRKAAVVLRANW
jgi:TonB-dependent receptor